MGWWHSSVLYKVEMHSHCEPANNRDPVHVKSPCLGVNPAGSQAAGLLTGTGGTWSSGSQPVPARGLCTHSQALLCSFPCYKLNVPCGSPGTTALITKINSPELLFVVHLKVNIAAVKVNKVKQGEKEGGGGGVVLLNLSFRFFVVWLLFSNLMLTK